MFHDGITSADIVCTEDGRQYHIGVGPGELAENILLCGDPARAHRTSKLFDEVNHEQTNREFVTCTGKYKGRSVSVMSTGIGPDNTEIAVIEAVQITKKPTFIRIGSCGALQPEINVGDLIITTGAVRLENTSTYFVPEGYPAVAHHEIVTALKTAVEKFGFRYHIGLTASAPGFYGAQSRKVPGFPSRFPDLPDKMAELNVLNYEMESSTLFTLCSIRGLRAGTICAVYANRPNGIFIDTNMKKEAELNCIKAGLSVFEMI